MTISRKNMIVRLIASAVALSGVALVTSRVAQDTDYYELSEAMLKDTMMEAEEISATVEKCTAELDEVFQQKGGGGFEGLSFVVHRNGEVDPCGTAKASLSAFQDALANSDKSCYDMEKYDFESLLTDMLSKTLEGDDCSSLDDDEAPRGLLGFCDMGEDRTPILLDHDSLVRVPSTDTLPCHFHTREGVRITAVSQLVELAEKARECHNGEEGEQPETCAAAEVHLYAVPAGRVFMFAPSYVGEIFELPHVEVPSGEPVYLEVLSLSPRVFDIFNFYSKEESDELVNRALAETSPTHKMKRSTTGTKENSVIAHRTSENGFDTHGKTALQIKRRCFNVLGFDEYLEGHSDGLQILRYNETHAYTSHMDYMTARGREAYDYDSSHKGGNRFATILLYMNDMHEGMGGETVFPGAWPPGLPEEERVPLEQAIEDLRASGEAKLLKEGSWEESLAAQCRTKLAVRPNAARAVLFYSQHPNGVPDQMSKHGACPILKGQKMAANLWVWNTPREDFEGAPIKQEFKEEYYKKKDQANSNGPQQLHATFRNGGGNPAYDKAVLYFDESGYWGTLGKNDPPLSANTYEGHKWNVRLGDEIVKTWVIGTEEEQEFVL